MGDNIQFVRDILNSVKGDIFWEQRIKEIIDNNPMPVNVHLAILVEPYLEFILAGKKTVESRFASVKCAPFESVQAKDIILLKRSGGPILGICQVSNVWFYRLDSVSLSFIKKEFAEAICPQGDNFWEERKDKTYATLMRISEVCKIKPINYEKKDRRGWVVIRKASNTYQLRLELD